MSVSKTADKSKILGMSEGVFTLVFWLVILAPIIIYFCFFHKTIKTETERIDIPFEKKVEYSANVLEGNRTTVVDGKKGSKIIETKVEYNGFIRRGVVETNERVTSEPVTELTIIGTKHDYTGYCEVAGTYRHRYAVCYGDYDPESKTRAEAKAAECNYYSTPIGGCDDIY